MGKKTSRRYSDNYIKIRQHPVVSKGWKDTIFINDCQAIFGRQV